MDFFEHQDRARRRTSLLIGYFILAVILIILAVYGVFVVVLMWLAKAPEARPHGTAAWWNPELFLWVVAGTVLVVAVGTLYKIMALSRGGEAVALMLGARPVLPATKIPLQPAVSISSQTLWNPSKSNSPFGWHGVTMGTTGPKSFISFPREFLNQSLPFEFLWASTYRPATMDH